MDAMQMVREQRVDFMPATYIKEVPVDSPENLIYLDPKGFETFDTGQSIALPELAQEVVDMMREIHLHVGA